MATQTIQISPTQSDVQTALGNFLTMILPSGVDVIAAQPNMVAEPKSTNFVMMSPIRFQRLATNRDTNADVAYTGSVAAGVLTVTAVQHGSVAYPAVLFGANIPDGTAITSQLTGTPGGVGTYQLDNATFTLAPATFASGAEHLQINSELTVQLDFHSADYSAAEMAQTASTLLRDEYATDYFAKLASPLNRIDSLYADDPARRPFVNDQQQYEWRWVIEARLQVNQIVIVPQQYATVVVVGLIEIDSHYPP